MSTDNKNQPTDADLFETGGTSPPSEATTNDDRNDASDEAGADLYETSGTSPPKITKKVAQEIKSHIRRATAAEGAEHAARTALRNKFREGAYHWICAGILWEPFANVRHAKRDANRDAGITDKQVELAVAYWRAWERAKSPGGKSSPRVPEFWQSKKHVEELARSATRPRRPKKPAAVSSITGPSAITSTALAVVPPQGGTALAPATVEAAVPTPIETLVSTLRGRFDGIDPCALDAQFRDIVGELGRYFLDRHEESERGKAAARLMSPIVCLLAPKPKRADIEVAEDVSGPGTYDLSRYGLDVWAVPATLPDGWYDLIGLDSPPYWQQMHYGKAVRKKQLKGRKGTTETTVREPLVGELGWEPTWEEHLDVLVKLFGEYSAKLSPDGVLAINYNDANLDGGGLPALPERLVTRLRDEYGLHLIERVYWLKSSFEPKNVMQRIIEPIFFFSKNSRRKLNWKHSIFRRSPTRATCEAVLSACRTGKNPHEVVNLDLGCRGTNVWIESVETHEGNHPCPFPTRLAERVVLCTTKPGARVLSMFSGSGSAGVAAVKHGRHFTGIELGLEYLADAEERMKAEGGTKALVDILSLLTPTK